MVNVVECTDRPILEPRSLKDLNYQAIQLHRSVFQDLHSRSKSRRGEVANRRNTLRILRIGQLDPTPDLGARGGFENHFYAQYRITARLRPAHTLVCLIGIS